MRIINLKYWKKKLEILEKYPNRTLEFRSGSIPVSRFVVYLDGSLLGGMCPISYSSKFITMSLTLEGDSYSQLGCRLWQVLSFLPCINVHTPLRMEAFIKTKKIVWSFTFSTFQDPPCYAVFSNPYRGKG